MAEQPRTGRLATASIVGTMLEYYDFAIYNTLAALVFNRLFFPSFDPLTGTILAFSTFAVGYFSRPIGGVIFGHLGDRYGRRFVLVATLHGDGRDDSADRCAADVRDRRSAEPDAAGRVAIRAGRGARRRVGGRGAALRRARRSASAWPQCFVGADGTFARHVARDGIDRRRDFAASPRKAFSRGAGACRSSPASCWSGSVCGSASACRRRRCSGSSSARRRRRARRSAKSCASIGASS